MAKAKIPTEEKFEKQDFDLFEALAAVDRKDYGYYDRLTEEQKKKFNPFMLIKWMSAVKSDTAIQQFHVLSVNEFTNKYFFNENVIKNPKLQWLMLCSSGLDKGKQFHQYIKPSKNTSTDIKDYLQSIYPYMKQQDIDTLCQFVTEKDIESHKNESGF